MVAIRIEPHGVLRVFGQHSFTSPILVRLDGIIYQPLIKPTHSRPTACLNTHGTAFNPVSACGEPPCVPICFPPPQAYQGEMVMSGCTKLCMPSLEDLDIPEALKSCKCEM